MLFYACADVAFVGGSLQDIGGHNLLEPAAAGIAIVTGPHLHNFSDIAAQLEQAGALRIGADAQAVGDDIAALLEDADARARMAAAARALVEQGRGALQRTLAAIARRPAGGRRSTRCDSCRGSPPPLVRGSRAALRPTTAIRRARCVYCAMSPGASCASASTVSRRLTSCTSAMSSVPAACSSSSRFCRKL